jgi:hypothetical protein
VTSGVINRQTEHVMSHSLAGNGVQIELGRRREKKSCNVYVWQRTSQILEHANF